MNVALLEGEAGFGEEGEHGLAGDAGQDLVRERPRDQRLALDDPGGRGGAFGDDAILHQPGFLRAALGGELLGEHRRQQVDALDVAARPAQIGQETTLMPVLAAGA